MNKYIKYIKLFLMILSFASLVVFVSPMNTFKDLGNFAWILLIIVMLVRPLRDIFPKCLIFSFLSKFRRELGIMMAVFWLAHWIGAFMVEMSFVKTPQTYLDLFLSQYTWDYTKYLFWWVLATILSIPLALTSNWISTHILWKHWKTLQRLSYAIFPLSAIHIAFIPLAHNRKIDYLPIVIVWIWVVLFVLAYLINKRKQKLSWNGPKWLCVPCGYIYDETVWDIDWEIQPWTKFEDIPDTWRCPVCGVWKWDFILLSSENVIDYISGKVVSKEYINENKDVIEFVVNLDKELTVKSGQFMSFVFNDELWEFRRSYSVAKKEWNNVTFLIKLNPDWRWAKILNWLKWWDKVKLAWVFWDFVLTNTSDKKIFIATGTWLAPIFNMMNNFSWEKILFFWVKDLKDIFYIEKLKSIANLTVYACLSREESILENSWNIKFIKWRIDIAKFIETWIIKSSDIQEFYLCWNPALVDWVELALKNSWINDVYKENF